MALTATANLKIRATVIKTLEMKGCSVLSHNPNKLNIYYEVAPKTDLESVLSPIVSQVSLKKRKTDRHILFCRTYGDTTVLYKALMLQLAEKDVLLHDDIVRICEKFTGCTSPAMKKNILESFTQPDGLVRIVVATIAFGMGLDSPNVRHVLHWEPPEDLEQYVQETGRGGCDGAMAKCILYFSPKDLRAKHHVTAGMEAYCENTVECRRVLLMRQFTEEIMKTPTHLHLCCDICTTVCTCADCQTFADSIDLSRAPDQTPSQTCALSANPIVQAEIKKQLLSYRKMLFLKSSP